MKLDQDPYKNFIDKIKKNKILTATKETLKETITIDIHKQNKQVPPEYEIKHFVQSIWKVLDSQPNSLIPDELKQTNLPMATQESYFHFTLKQLRIISNEYKFFTPNEIQTLATTHQFEYTPGSILENSLRLNYDRWVTIVGLDWEWQIKMINLT